MRLAPLSALALSLALFAGTTLRAADAPSTAPATNASTATITGKVVDKDAKPVADAAVTLKIHLDKGAKKAPADPSAPILTAKTDATGAFSIASVPPGTYDANAKTKDGAGKSLAPITVKAGDTVDAGTIALAPKGAKAPKTPKTPKTPAVAPAAN